MGFVCLIIHLVLCECVFRISSDCFRFMGFLQNQLSQWSYSISLLKWCLWKISWAEYIHLKVFLGKVLKVLLRLSKTCTLCNAQAFTEIADFPSDWITNSNERYLRFHNKIIWKFSKSSSGYDKCYNTLFHECTIGLTFSTKHSQAFTFFH